MSPSSNQRWRSAFLAVCLLTAAASTRCAQWTGEDPQAYGPIWATILAYVAGVIDLTPITVSEGGSGAAFTLKLNKAPTDDVSITATYSGEITINGQPSPYAITFTSSNWNIPQTFLVNAVDDAVAEGVHEAQIEFAVSSADSSFASYTIAPLRVRIVDNDSGGIIVNQSGGTTLISEAGLTDAYSVVLSFPPAATVTVTVTPDAQVRVNGSAAPIMLSFNAGNWSVPQMVTVSAVDDLASEGAHTGAITHSASSADPSYNGIAIAGVTAQISDNDTPGVTITESAGATAVTEAGGTDMYSIVLNSLPAGNVVVTVTPDAQTTCAPCAASFTVGNWNVPQPITVGAVNDSIAEGAHAGTLTHTVTSIDPGYNGIPAANVPVTIGDNDSVGITLTQSAGSTNVNELGPSSDTYTLVLTSQPTANVTIAPTTCAGGQVTLSPVGPYVFTTANWSMAQTITVTAVNDSIVEGTPHFCSISHAATSGDADYNGLGVMGSPFNAVITDNDMAGVTIVESGGATQVNEQGTTIDTFTFRLNTQPSNNVSVAIACTAATCTAAPPLPLIFTSADWNMAQTVTVMATDDGAPGPFAGTATFTLTSLDTDYNGLGAGPLNYTVIDNDTAGITVTPTPPGPLAVTEGAAGVALSFVLNSAPTANVDITINADADTRVNGAASHVLTFTTANWFTAQNVTISATDDALQEGTETTPLLTFAVASGDANYNLFAIANMNVTVVDNDVKRIFVSSVNQTGDLGNINGADAICDNDPTAPAGLTFKAMLVDGITRIACTTANCSTGTGEHTSWVLQPNMQYYITAGGAGAFGALAFTTNADGIAPFNWSNPVGANAIWTGLNADWTSASFPNGNCFLWTDGTATWTGIRGLSTAVNSQAIFVAGGVACNGTRRLYCVEQ